jgi:hypothetical protein
MLRRARPQPLIPAPVCCPRRESDREKRVREGPAGAGTGAGLRGRLDGHVQMSGVSHTHVIMLIYDQSRPNEATITWQLPQALDLH